MNKIKLCGIIGLILVSCATSKAKRLEKSLEEVKMKEQCYQVVCSLYQEGNQIPIFKELQKIRNSLEDKAALKCFNNTIEQVSKYNFSYFDQCNLKGARMGEILQFYLAEDETMPHRKIPEELADYKLEGVCKQAICSLYEKDKQPLMSSLWWQIHEYSSIHPNKELKECFGKAIGQIKHHNLESYLSQCGLTKERITELESFYFENRNK